jgi:signal transduction histidine kinase
MNAPFAVSLVSAVRAFLASLRPPGEALTLDRLRSDLSHETAAKIARLTGLVQEWRAGDFQPTDPADARDILLDLRRIFLRHARLAAARPDTLLRLVRLLSLVESARGRLPARSFREAPSAPQVERFAALVAGLHADSRALVETLSSRYGERVGNLLTRAVAEISVESGGADPGGGPVALEDDGCGAGAWVPRREAAQWADVFRNLLRNAVQATADKRAGGGPEAPGRVTARLQPMPGASGVTLEILDEGVGMTPEQVARMWSAGESTHGPNRGQVLTEGKRAFLARRAGLEVRSVPGVGTCVRVDLPHRDLPVRPPRLWAMPTVSLPAAVILIAAAAGATRLAQPPVMSLDVDPNQRVLRARDARGALVWQREMDQDVLPNFRGSVVGRKGGFDLKDRQLVLPGGGGAIVATQPPEGPARLRRLAPDGADVWTRTLRWIPPRTPHEGHLKAVFIVPLRWDRPPVASLAVNVRDADYSSTCIEFFTPRGDSLGAYYHPGQMEFEAVADVDGDGREEALFRVINNAAMEDTGFVPGGSNVYLDGLALLKPPGVNGQAYPYTNWPGAPRAREEAYLLFPPLRRGVRPAIVRVTLGGSAEVQLADGRIYHLDRRLRPVSCGVGDFTTADSLAPTRALAPLLYIHDGTPERIEVPVRRGTG